MRFSGVLDEIWGFEDFCIAVAASSSFIHTLSHTYTRTSHAIMCCELLLPHCCRLLIPASSMVLFFCLLLVVLCDLVTHNYCRVRILVLSPYVLLRIHESHSPVDGQSADNTDRLSTPGPGGEMQVCIQTDRQTERHILLHCTPTHM